VQLFHQGWDQHGDVVGGITRQGQQTDQASAALVTDLKRRGLLDDTLVVWGGEFGRTAYCQGKMAGNNYGRDHHPRCFSLWLAGGGVKAGYTHGLTDDYGYNILEGPVHVHDLHATMLHLMGVDHEKLIYKTQGRYFRLTDIAGHLVKPILA
jgi:arylsulfatase A-like enzyme